MNNKKNNNGRTMSMHEQYMLTSNDLFCQERFWLFKEENCQTTFCKCLDYMNRSAMLVSFQSKADVIRLNKLCFMNKVFFWSVVKENGFSSVSTVCQVTFYSHWWDLFQDEQTNMSQNINTMCSLGF